jgi:hypothetical protein
MVCTGPTITLLKILISLLKKQQQHLPNSLIKAISEFKLENFIKCILVVL